MRIFFITIVIFMFPIFALADSVVFDYDDFGPQVLAYETIGYQWYQWNSSGDSDPTKIDDIKVVVYWHESIEIIKKQYPIDTKRKKDFRYLSYEAAIKYLNTAIDEVPAEKNLISTRDTLERLRNN